MSLSNLLWARRLFWDGRSSSLEEQALTPLVNAHEMGQTLALSCKKLQNIPQYPLLFKSAFGDSQVTGQRIVKALSQFERTLISCHSRYDDYLNHNYVPTPDEIGEMTLFMAGYKKSHPWSGLYAVSWWRKNVYGIIP